MCVSGLGSAFGLFSRITERKDDRLFVEPGDDSIKINQKIDSSQIDETPRTQDGLNKHTESSIDLLDEEEGK